MSDERLGRARELLAGYLSRTGIAGPGDPAQRYLWTDAFAVTALLALAQRTGERRFLDRALELVETLNTVLGRYRKDDARSGWISGLAEPEGARRPTAGGLRICKPLPERGPDEPLDERLEWGRDGQYFHYLTRWMEALDRLCIATGETRFARLARELARAAHRAFVYRSPAGAAKRMYWKMSTDLSRPLVDAMGALDPLDGFVTFGRLRATSLEMGLENPGLDDAIADFREMCAAGRWDTSDPLGIGGLLCETGQLTRLIARGAAETPELLEDLLAGAGRGLEAYARTRRPTSSAPAFRELGLAIGLQWIEPMRSTLEQSPGSLLATRAGTLTEGVRLIARFAPLGEEIVLFWLDPGARTSPAWEAHQDINDVMLAASCSRFPLLECEVGWAVRQPF